MTSPSPAITLPEGYDADVALRLDNQLCFPLWAAAKEVVRRYAPMLDELGITYTQYICLMALWEKDEIGVRELGSRLYLDSGTLTPLLKKLEAKGLVRRSRSEADERAIVIRLTEEGRSLKGRAATVPLRIAGCFDLEPEEAVQLVSLLRKVLDGPTAPAETGNGTAAAPEAVA